jgi:SAM-dependent methyltransferase
MDARDHWDTIYRKSEPNQVSWYRPHLETSLALIEQTGSGPHASVIDVGAGESTLVDDLLTRGYSQLTVLDISPAAIAACRARLGVAAERVRWLAADITQCALEPAAYDVWHDRAVFHFLTAESERRPYVRAVVRSVRRGGHVIVSAFGPEGPTQCSGLEVVRYNSDSLHAEFGANFRLVSSSRQVHETPFGTTQQFLYCYCVVQ